MSLIADLQAIVGAEHASATDAHRDHYSRDQSAHPASPPDAVVWPQNTAQVSAIARYANAQRVPLVGWGAGTSLEGNPIPVQGGIVVDFSRMDRILAVHAHDFQVTVQPGVRYKAMNAQLSDEHGLFFPPDPGAQATVGGMVANNAAGTRTVKYGATRDNVLALEVVLANGEIVKTGSRSIKQASGYDLTHLFTGSEGTLGLITEITLRLYPVLPHASAITAAFPSLSTAATAVYAIMAAGLNPGALELVDATTIRAMQQHADLAVADGDNLFIEFSGASEAALAEELKLAEQLCREAGCTDFRAGLGHAAHQKLWEVRHNTFNIMVSAHPNQQWSVTDVAVPISHYPTLATLAADAIIESGLPGSIVGHAGDGNLHTLTFFDNAAGQARAAAINKALVERALELDGTCTGEHGVGLGKRPYMLAEHGQPALDLMRQLKHTLDPNNILNPGKVV